MEDRTLLSPLSVMNNADSGSGSLRAAIFTANNNSDPTNTITFAPSLAGRTITLTTGELAITKSLTISGPGANLLTISGNNTSRVFDISGGKTVTIAGLTIAHGKAATGGGIDNAGTLTLTNSTLANNQAVGGMGGGGILNEASARLTLDHDALTGNLATTSVGSDVFGGGLLNLGVATVTSSTFKGNQALGGGSGTFFGGSVGGGIDNFGGATLIVTGITFINNQAISTDKDGLFFGIGGAIENNAGFGGGDSSTATISNSTFTDNRAIGGGGDSSGNGGAIDNEGAGATMTLTNSRLIDNQSIGGDRNNGLGGGILNLFGKLTVKSSTLSGNQAKGGPGGTSPDSLSLGEGGGILNASAVLIVNDSMFFGNQALGGTTTLGRGGAAIGGGIENVGTAILYLNNSTLSGNQAIAGSGSTNNSTPQNLGLAAGGGLDNSLSSTAKITGSQIINNQALGGAGGPGFNGGDAWGGGIAVGIGVFGLPDTSSITVSNSVIVSNLARGGNGGSGAIGGNGQGGGIWFGPVSTGTLDNSVITGNFALGGRAGAGGSAGAGLGGGLYVATNSGVFALVNLKKSLVILNFASTSNDNIYGTVTYL